MSRLSRFIDSLTQGTPTIESASSDASPRIVNLVFSEPSLEAYADQIVQALDGTETIIERVTLPSLESQQQDLANQTEALKARFEDLASLINPTYQTGSVQVFLLDEEGLAAGHAGSASALTALVRASLQRDVRLVAALTSQWKAPTAPAANDLVDPRLVAGERAVLKSWLKTQNIASCESLDELLDILKN